MKQMTYSTDCRSDIDADLPYCVEFTLDMADAVKIAKMACQANLKALYKTVVFETLGTFYLDDPKTAGAGYDNEARMDCDTLEVGKDDFLVAALMKHTNVKVLSDNISIDSLLADFGLPALPSFKPEDAGDKSEWLAAVAAGNTELGYWEWVIETRYPDPAR